MTKIGLEAERSGLLKTEFLIKFGYWQKILNGVRTTKTWCYPAHLPVFCIS